MEKNLLKLLKKRLPFQKKEQGVSFEAKPMETSKKISSKKPIEITDNQWQEFNQKSENKTSEKQPPSNVTTKKEKNFTNLKIEKKNIPSNKNKIPVIDKEKDFEKIFQDPKYQKKGKSKVKSQPVKPQIKRRNDLKKNFKNKNGIRVIKNTSDLNDFFLSCEEKTSIKSINHPPDNERAFLNAKKGETSKNRPVPLEKRISRYPKPELTLDLHGFSSIQAKLKVENFINSSFKKGFFTLKIITGKGNHSDLGAVLPQVTEDIVKEMINANKVLHYKWENIVIEASGSMIVYLNRFND